MIDTIVKVPNNGINLNDLVTEERRLELVLLLRNHNHTFENKVSICLETVVYKVKTEYYFGVYYSLSRQYICCYELDINCNLRYIVKDSSTPLLRYFQLLIKQTDVNLSDMNYLNIEISTNLLDII